MFHQYSLRCLARRFKPLDCWKFPSDKPEFDRIGEELPTTPSGVLAATLV